MPSIQGITQAFGYIAAYAGERKKLDRFEPVIVWSVIEFDDDDDPDEVIGQIFDGTCITEATAVDEEEGYGDFIGYFRDTEEGRAEAKSMCEEARERKKALEEEGEETPQKKRKNKNKASEEEEEDEAEETDDGEEDDDEESDNDDDGEDDDDDEESDNDDDGEDDFSSWDG